MYYNLLTLVHGHVDSGSYAADVDTNAHGEDIGLVNIIAGNHPNSQPPADVVESPVPPVIENTANSKDTSHPAPPYRKCKRPRVVLRALVGDYQCDKCILTRAWEAHVNAIRRVPNIDYDAEFGELSVKIDSSFAIKLGGLSLSSKELSAIVDRFLTCSFIIPVLFSYPIPTKYNQRTLFPGHKVCFTPYQDLQQVLQGI
ncbi:hypothetical protein Bca4012_050603 [Brassica carinata]|uniref:Uncharacterized protein n=1 Tax=Brassica carinata TaxID=52824 RepID=A0A8X7R3X9_BRACI|nr:hypothetical protein Bca52824_053299 [Brassica carinata]